MRSLSKKASEALGYITFLLWPVISLFVAIKYYRAPWAKNIVWLFIAFYAYHFIPPGEGVDILSYIERFEYYQRVNYSLETFIISLYSEGSRTVDVIEPLLSYTLSKITSNYKILLLFYGLIYGYFYSRNIWFFLDELKGKIKIKTIIILLLLLVTIGIWNINGIRFWGAVHIFIYGFYNLIILKKKRGLIFLLLAPLMHLGIVLPGVIVLIFNYFKTPGINLLFPAFIFTFFLAELDLDNVRNIITQYAPDFTQEKLTAYTSEEYVEGVAEKFQAYSIAYHISKIVGVILKTYFILILYFNRKLLSDDSKKLFQFILFYGIFANLLIQIPSGGRFALITAFLLYGTMVIFVQNNYKFKLGRILTIFYPVILLYTVYQFRIIGFDTFSIHHFINNPLFSMFIY